MSAGFEPLISTEEAAKLLGQAAGTLRRWRCERTGPNYVQQNGRNVKYRREDLIRWVNEKLRITPMRAA